MVIRSHFTTKYEQRKRHRLEYAFISPKQVGEWELLGSIIRAVGKGWSVLAVVPENKKRSFSLLKKSLQNTKLLNISQFKILKNLTKNTSYDLVLSGYKKTLINTKVRHYPRIFSHSHIMTIENSPSKIEYDLISKIDTHTFASTGILAITGTGKGKTTTALGIAAESIVKNGKVAVIQWFKERKKAGELTWAINEHEFPNKLKNTQLLTFYPTGLGFFGSQKMDRVKGESAYQKHRQKAYQGLTLAYKILEKGEHELLILDEFIDTVAEIAQNIQYPLIDLVDVQKLLQVASNQSKMKVVVTGRRVSEHWQKYIGTSIMIHEVKHPWSSKKAGAVSGLDF